MARAPQDAVMDPNASVTTEVGVQPGEDLGSPTSMVLRYITSRGYKPTSGNVRTVMDELQRNPNLIPGLRSDRPATEAEDQTAMVRARSGTGGGGAPGNLVQEEGTWDLGGRTGTGPTIPSDRRGSPATSAAPPAASQPPAPVTTQPPAVTPAPTADAGQPTTAATVAQDVLNGVAPTVNSVMDPIKQLLSQNPPAPVTPVAPTPTEPDVQRPTPWIVQQGLNIADQARRSNAVAAANPTPRTPIQMYGGVPNIDAPLPAPPPPVTQQQAAQNAYPQRTGPVVRPSVMLSRPPNPLDAALQRALQDRRNQAVDDSQTRGATVATR